MSTSLSPSWGSPSPSWDSASQGDGERAQPPPPSPSSVSTPPPDFEAGPIASCSTSCAPVWPLDHVICLDPLSKATQQLTLELEEATRGRIQLTTALSDATHLVIDPSTSFDGAVLLAQVGRLCASSHQYLVNFEWIQHSLLAEEWQPEERYASSGLREVQQKHSSRSKGKGREVANGLDDGQSMMETALPSSGKWTDQEDDALARFLLPIDDYAAVDENGRDAFDGFATTNHTERPAAACRRHYRSSKSILDTLVGRLRAGLSMREVAESSESRRRKGKASSVEVVETPVEIAPVDAEASEDGEDAPEADYELGTRPNSYNAEEEADFRTLLKESDTVVQASTKMSQLHPSRSYESVRRRYNRLRANYEGELVRKPNVRGGAPYWLPAEQEELAVVLAGSEDNGIAIYRVFSATNPMRSVAAIRAQHDRHRIKYDQRVKEIKEGLPLSSSSIWNAPSPSPPPQQPLPPSSSSSSSSSLSLKRSSPSQGSSSKKKARIGIDAS